MEKIRLAQELRNRQIELGVINLETISKLTDNEIIESYITCSSCHRKQIHTEEEINKVIQISRNVVDFLKICDAIHTKDIEVKI